MTAVRFKSRTLVQQGYNGCSKRISGGNAEYSYKLRFHTAAIQSVTKIILTHLWPEVCYTDGIFDAVQGRNCAVEKPNKQ